MSYEDEETPLEFCPECKHELPHLRRNCQVINCECTNTQIKDDRLDPTYFKVRWANVGPGFRAIAVGHHGMLEIRGKKARNQRGALLKLYAKLQRNYRNFTLDVFKGEELAIQFRYQERIEIEWPQKPKPEWEQ